MRRRFALRSAGLAVLLGGTFLLVFGVRGGDAVRPTAAAPVLRAESEAPIRAQLTAPTGFPQIAPDRTQVGLVPTFGQPTIAGIQGTGFEPDLRIDPANPNRLYASVPGSLSANDSWIWHSTDAGRTWKWVTASHPKVGKPVACAGGGDTELAVDTAGHLYFNDLTLANFSVSRSDNQGTSFPICNNTAVPNIVVDRQWYATDGDPTQAAPAPPSTNALYFAHNVVGLGAPQCPVSGVGNNTLVVYRSLPGPLAGLQFGPANYVAGLGTCDEGIMGNIEVSPVPTTTGEVGQPPLAAAVRHVYVVHDDASFSKIRVARCFPVSTGLPVVNVSDPSGLRCNDLLVRDLGNFANVRTGANFPTIAIDNAGNLYVVWQEAPVDAAGNIGDTALHFSYSTNEGATWSTPLQVSPPSLKNNVMSWIVAGDDGRADIAWYGTTGGVNIPNTCTVGAIPPPTPHGGPDSVNAPWSLYLAQSLNAHSAAPTFAGPLLAGEHHMHRGGIASVMGGLCGDRSALGDFFQLRVGAQGEANIIYADSNNVLDIGHMMFVRQIDGPGLYASQTVTGDPILTNSATDPAGDGVRELDGLTGANVVNLDLLGSSFTRPAAASCHPAATPCYRIQMTLGSLASLAPPLPDLDIVWSTQWLAPSSHSCATADVGCTNGGRNFHVYAESLNGAAIRCFQGENSIQALGGGVTMTYPPDLFTEITASGACTVTGSTITIEVPIADVSLEPGVPPFDPSRLYSVTTSTMALPSTADSAPPLGVPPDVIDVVRGYDVQFGTTAVKVTSFSARSRPGRVVLRWRTASEASLSGFNVYRGTTRLNRRLIAATGQLHGHAYAWAGRVSSARGPYRLQAVGLDGRRTWIARTTSR